MAPTPPTADACRYCRRALDDPAWWAVVHIYAIGAAAWPDPFQPRQPSAPPP